MKDIFAILKEFGLEVPVDKTEDFKKAVLENYKTVAELENLQGKLSNLETTNAELKTKYDTDIQIRDTDLADLKAKLEAAGTDSQALADLQTKFNDLSATYETAKTEYQKQLDSQRYEFLIKEATNALNFSSNSAKKAFLADAMEKKLTVSDGKLLGFNDFVDAYKASDADAFKATEPAPQQQPPYFTGKSGTAPSPQPEPSKPVIL